MHKKGKIATVVALVIVGVLIIGLVAAKPGKPACKDGNDNDGDGLIDFPEDPGCSTKNDRDEFNDPIYFCGDNICNSRTKVYVQCFCCTKLFFNNI